MIEDIIKVFRSAKNWRFLNSQAAWIAYLKGLDDRQISILIDLIQHVDTKRIDLGRLSGYITMASMDRLPNFEKLGLDRSDSRLYDNSWSIYEQ